MQITECKRSERSIDLLPHWRIVPPEQGETAATANGGSPPTDVPSGISRLVIASGPGFGLGGHETTQLCLFALGYLTRVGFRPRKVLDFGSGSGILSVAAAQRGAQVEAVEIDVAANEHARTNARLNGVEAHIEIRERMSVPPPRFDMVLANILRPVLLEFAESLCERQDQGGHMLLSGLLGTDVPDILGRYTPLLPRMSSGVYERGEWRAVMFSPR